MRGNEAKNVKTTGTIVLKIVTKSPTVTAVT